MPVTTTRFFGSVECSARTQTDPRPATLRGDDGATLSLDKLRTAVWRSLKDSAGAGAPGRGAGRRVGHLRCTGRPGGAERDCGPRSIKRDILTQHTCRECPKPDGRASWGRGGGCGQRQGRTLLPTAPGALSEAGDHICAPLACRFLQQ